MAINWLKIDGVTMPTPMSLAPTWADFDSEDSTRNLKGNLFREVIRTNVRSPEFSWRLKTPDFRKLLKACKPAKIKVQYPDPLEDSGVATITAYAQATRKAPLLQQAKDIEDCWWDFSCTFIEY